MSYAAYGAVIAAGQSGPHALRHVAFGCAIVLLFGYLLTGLSLELILRSGLLAEPHLLYEGTTPAAMLLLLGSFAVWPLAIAGGLAIAHRRSFGSLLGQDTRRLFLRTSFALLALNAVIFVLPPWGWADLAPHTPLRLWLSLLPIALGAVLVQVAAEELLFRGYLQQALAAARLPAWVWLTVPSVLFGLGHYDVSAGENTWLIVLWAAIFGMLMADLTARSGSIGPAVAVHLANNVAALLIAGLNDSLNGLALYTYPLGLTDEAALRALLPVDFMIMGISWLTARLVLRR